MSVIPELFLRIHDRHGHYCPMSTLGARLGLAAMQALGATSAELRAWYHIETCAIDGIALTTGCLPEQGRLTVLAEGRHRLRLQDDCGHGVCAELTAGALERAAACRRLLDAGDPAAEAALAALRSDPLAELVQVWLVAEEPASHA
ncbi:MAG: formylmethanofuran dehydrogenase subunit E family protein [Trichloromonadaceae bacterium]